MSRLARVGSILILLILSACSQSMYEGMRMRRQMECDNLQGPQRDACYRRSEMSYDEYQRKLKEQDRSRRE